MTYRHLIALTAILTHTAFGALSAPMPAFKTASQLATWRAEMAAKPTSRGDSAEESAFFTGKPYIDASGGYAFKYRSYNPELARWTSEDPSGFPDGANANIYAAVPTIEFDFQGLRVATVGDLDIDFYTGEMSATRFVAAGILSGAAAAITTTSGSWIVAAAVWGASASATSLIADLTMTQTSNTFSEFPGEVGAKKLYNTKEVGNEWSSITVTWSGGIAGNVQYEMHHTIEHTWLYE